MTPAVIPVVPQWSQASNHKNILPCFTETILDPVFPLAMHPLALAFLEQSSL